MTDVLDTLAEVMIVSESGPAKMPEVVLYCCDGILTERAISDAAYRSVIGTLAAENRWFAETLEPANILSKRELYTRLMGDGVAG